jgi:hypothetical protein
MSTKHRLSAASATLAIVTCVAVIGAASAGGDPTFPPVPPINVHLPKAHQIAYFKVIVEGKATDDLKSQLSGETGTCLYEEDGDVSQTSIYQRGRGATFQFDRYGQEALLHRVGRETDSSLGVQVSTTRTASGGSHASPAHPPLPCDVPPRSLSTSDCGKPFPEGGSASFTYEGDRLGLTIAPKGTPSPKKNTCGEDPQTGLTLAFEHAWPTVPKFTTSALPLGRVFGKAHAFKVEMRVSDVNAPPRQSPPRHVGFGSLAGTVVETPTNIATVRFVRLKHG